MKPVLQSLVLADHIYQDRETGKKIICGTFNTIKFSRRPPVVEIERPDGVKQQALVGGVNKGSPYAYLNLTDVCDETKLTLQFVDLTRNTVLFGTEATIHHTDRLKPVELVFPLPVLPISEVGTYALEVVCDGDILGSWRVMAQDVNEKAEPPQESNH